MSFKEAFGKLKESPEFNEWQKKNPDAFLAHFFNLLDAHYVPSDWEAGFYDKNKDRITAFIVGDKILVKPEDEVFKKEEHHVHELALEKIKTELSEVIKTFKKCQETKYAGQWPVKVFVILQELGEGPVWNITAATQAFSALNIKVSAVDGKIISDACESFFDLRVKDNQK